MSTPDTTGSNDSVRDVSLSHLPDSIRRAIEIPDAFLAAHSGDIVLAGDEPAGGELIGDESVAEGGVVGVDVEGGVGEVCIIPIALPQRGFAPLVEALGGEPKNPAGHRDGDTVSRRSRTSG
jgi:hypothetical protein